MVMDKSRTWRALLLALFFNLQAKLYYPLLSSDALRGGQDTFPLASLALHQPIYLAAPLAGEKISSDIYIISDPSLLTLWWNLFEGGSGDVWGLGISRHGLVTGGMGDAAEPPLAAGTNLGEGCDAMGEARIAPWRA